MPEFILPAEADRCVYCDDVLRDPPFCCEQAIADSEKDLNKRLAESCSGCGYPHHMCCCCEETCYDT